MQQEAKIYTLFKDVKCSNCGAILLFKPNTNNLVCEYCGTDNCIDIEEDEEIEEIDYEAFIHQEKDLDNKQEVTLVQCDSCAAKTSLPPNITAADCAFCGTSLILETGTTNTLIKPEGILPFKIEDKQAQELFQKWLSSLWFAPNNLKKQARNEKKLVGVYIPYWTYDARTYSRYHGHRGRHRVEYQQQLVTINGRRTRQNVAVTKTDWTPVSGHLQLFFDDVLILASSTLPKNYLAAIEPFDLSQLVPFKEAYLSGFRCESYQLNVKDGLGLAKKKMDIGIKRSVLKDIGGDAQRISSVYTEHFNITFKHILLPIWISNYHYKNKVFRFVINGQTGQVQGERPYSVIKIMAFSLFIATIIFLLFIAFSSGDGSSQGIYIRY